MGSAGIDYLALVAAYPRPDDKLRTERLELQGGGNCANALTGAARLGLSPTLITKIGDDGLGNDITSELIQDGVDTQYIIKAPGAPSPFTYIIVDKKGGTRTCIHTPGEPMRPDEMTQQLASSILQNASLVYFDGRLTEAALVLARAAKASNVPVLVEAERLRPGLEELLQEADYVVTSAHFPADWTGESCIGDAITSTFSRLPKVKWMITTLGSKGSVLLERQTGSREISGALNGGSSSSGEATTTVVTENLINDLFAQASSTESTNNNTACIASTGLEILPGQLATSSSPCQLTLSRGNEASAQVAAAISAASTAAAIANADSSNASKYAFTTASANTDTPVVVEAFVTVAQAARIPSEAVVDTTGAGDSFIGSILYTIAMGKDVKEGLRLGGVVAACKCTALGARAGLPKRQQLAEWIL